ncbi:hypothetical protein P153DRAFT_3084 [Dothidotthia symphoricarpi CBS 119687]|uniref:Uncharacterized protein n=1 Tax=Dothidotthia symphoricarpi CBS 119687 TaxID=1392245 RepID=A0A6A6ASF0_9PLEO|nr:uncharacterized protein P153DRAFT_3084 [Dothidotthia symphoricarpi CBS 119687]KAF2134496.1 hypothetical protein P153DRAFT_3084 [Dothidotthia symphoricarpi CBS 119687]
MGLLQLISRMLFRRQSTTQQEAVPPSGRIAFDLINYDILDVVMHHVYLDHRSDLLQICQVSKRLYMASIPWIYRNIHIDISDESSPAFLARIAKDSSGIATFVQTLELKGCADAPPNAWAPLPKYVRQLTGLRKFIWNGFANIPQPLLDALLLYPRVTLEIRGAQIYYKRIGDEFAPSINIFNGLALLQLTHFVFRPPTVDHLFRNFKRDLLYLLAKAPALRELEIYRGPIEEGFRVFPQMLNHVAFKRNLLPQLHALRLLTWSIIFTDAELTAWGNMGGWTNLRRLVCPHPSNLLSFLYKSPVLSHLDLLMYTSESMKELEERLEECSGNPFGPIQIMRYLHLLTTESTPEELEHVIPWCVIRKIADTLVHFECGDTSLRTLAPRPAAPTKNDLSRLRSMCPDLKDLSLDLIVDGPSWPHDLLAELCQFRQLARLALWLHEPLLDTPFLQGLTITILGIPESAGLFDSLTPPISPILATKENYNHVVGVMIATRRAYGLPVTQRFRASFKRVRELYEREPAEHWPIPDYVYDTGLTGQVTINALYIRYQKDYAERRARELYTRMTCDELIDLLKIVNQSILVTRVSSPLTLDEDRILILDEILRRGKRLRGITYNTLYDRLIDE